MKVIIRLSAREELRALPILLRHSPGVVLPDRTYILSVEAVRALRSAGVKFRELSRDAIVVRSLRERTSQVLYNRVERFTRPAAPYCLSARGASGPPWRWTLGAGPGIMM